MDIQPSFKADSQLAKACKPAVRPLHHPPVFAQPLAALNASSGNSANDAPPPQVGSASLQIVAFVGVQLGWSFTRTPWQACNRRNRVHALLEHLGVMPVRTADQDHQRNAPGIYDDVSFGAELASVRGVGTRFLALPVAQAPPASHATAVSERLGKVLPWNACLQHEQDAVEGGFIADCELARTAFGRRHDGWDQGL